MELIIYLVIFAFILEHWKDIAFCIGIILVVLIICNVTESKPKYETRKDKQPKQKDYYIQKARKNIDKESLERFMIACNAQIQHNEEMEQYNRANEEKLDKRVVNNRKPQIDIDAYARYCNAYLEHQEEMEQYKDNN